MPEVSLIRLTALRALYLVIFLLVPALSWAKILDPAQSWGAGDSGGVTVCMLAAFSLLSGLGLRYPLQMLPLLFWELAWKAIWMARVALPLWLAGPVDDTLRDNSIAIGLGAILLVVIPWRYVFAHYLKKPGDRWTRQAAF
jgi:hypothetical protein